MVLYRVSFLLFLLIDLSVCVHASALKLPCHSAHVEVGEELSGARSLPPPLGGL